MSESGTWEYRQVNNDRGRKQISTAMNEAGAEGWRFAAVLETTRWGSEQKLGLVVLMERRRLRS